MTGQTTRGYLDGVGAPQNFKVNDSGAGDEVFHVFNGPKLVSGSFTRPNDTTTYAVGDLVANSTAAGSVLTIPLTVGRQTNAPGNSGMIRRVNLYKSGATITSANFRVHFYAVQTPTFANGDNGVWSTNQVANYLGAVDIVLDRLFTDGAYGSGIPITGAEINFAQQIIYAVVEARNVYAPAANEVFTITLEVLQN